ncbi:MAG: hypothetical protein PWR29_841 [Methanolobus sp.]|jgi:hypothetical protein|nr:hypothetical protein [Methanolobus sp.]MDK2833796.1 hypothetical protein [Methanolobus sp.]MDK2911884.1 hypothetical protein [Methanolobus sp.]MDN5310559.1 hypothetical protein [Methanolobus sp.]
MRYTLISLDISTKKVLKKDFIGAAFRGWLGHALKCDTKRSCADCGDTLQCPYFMVFREHSEVRPYSLMAFKDKENITAFIRLFGDKKKMAPRILSSINARNGIPNFDGLEYNIESIEAKNLEIKPVKMGNILRLVTTSPLSLKSNGQLEVLPSFNTLLRSCIRSYNKITKYHDIQNYPFHVSEEIRDLDAELLDFDVQVVKHQHTNIKKKTIKMGGISGWMDYETSSMPAEVATILGMGESLQIGKHTVYGYGGFMMLDREDLT